ncbi:MAG TPA: inositol monophosphatase family protein [Candidatus Saccharimonadales bacterium]|nr:inositol monophosphatase family protein [Candidatus Saccharimonadales bacterium]
MTAPYSVEDLQHALQFMSRAMRRGGGVARADFRRPGVTGHEKPGEGIVTPTDRLIESMLNEALLSRGRPNEGLVAEEARRTWNWVLDALDGSRNFAEGVALHVIMASLNNPLGQPVLGIIHDPYPDDMFEAIQGMGARLNGAPISVNSNRQIAGSRIVVPSEKVDGMDVGGLVKCLIDMGAEIIASGSFGHDGTRLAMGNVTGLIYPYSSPWDVSAIKVLAEEAKRPDGTGGRTTSLTGDEQDYTKPVRGAVVSNGLIHEELLGVVRPFLVTA